MEAAVLLNDSELRGRQIKAQAPSPYLSVCLRSKPCGLSMNGCMKVSAKRTNVPGLKMRGRGRGRGRGGFNPYGRGRWGFVCLYVSHWHVMFSMLHVARLGSCYLIHTSHPHVNEDMRPEAVDAAVDGSIIKLRLHSEA